MTPDKEQVKNIIAGENMIAIQLLKLIETLWPCKDVDALFGFALELDNIIAIIF